MKRGDSTRTEILDVALDTARRDGLEMLTIGSLARAVEMSKSGLFAHFESKANLQRAVLDHAANVFVEQIVRPALAEPRGEPRLRALFENWLGWARSESGGGGCIFLAAATELDDVEGPVRDFLVKTQRDWLHTLERCIGIAQEEGHIRGDVNPAWVAYRFYANMMGFHFYARLLRDPNTERLARETFEALIEECR